MCRKPVRDMWTIRASSALIHIPERREHAPGAVYVFAIFFLLISRQASPAAHAVSTVAAAGGTTPRIIR